MLANILENPSFSALRFGKSQMSALRYFTNAGHRSIVRNLLSVFGSTQQHEAVEKLKKRMKELHQERDLWYQDL